MKAILVAAGLLTSAAMLTPAVAQMTPPDSPTTQTCEADWKRVDVSANGVLDGAELDKIKDVMSTVDTDKDGKVSRAEFLAACSKGTFKTIRF